MQQKMTLTEQIAPALSGPRPPDAAGLGRGWKEANRTRELSVFTRDRVEAQGRDVVAVGTVDADPPWNLPKHFMDLASQSGVNGWGGAKSYWDSGDSISGIGLKA